MHKKVEPCSHKNMVIAGLLLAALVMTVFILSRHRLGQKLNICCAPRTQTKTQYHTAAKIQFSHFFIPWETTNLMSLILSLLLKTRKKT